MGFFKSLFGGNNTPETEKEKNDKKNFEILKYDGIRARHMGKLPYAIKCFEEAVAINDEMETLTLLANAYIQANRLDDARITFNRMAECHCHADQSNCLKRRLYGGIPITC